MIKSLKLNCFIFLVLPFWLSAKTFKHELIFERDSIKVHDSLKLKRNEFRLNVLDLVLLPGINVSYEHLLNKNSSVGIGLYTAINYPENLLRRNLEITPNYRIYFGNTNILSFLIRKNNDFYAAGSFVEFQMLFASSDPEVVNRDILFSDDELTKSYNGIGMGFSTGLKLVSKNNITFETFTSVGRFLNNHYSQYYLRFGASLGFRF